MVRIFILIFLALVFSCSGENRRAFIPFIEGYNEDLSETKILPDLLDEISGIFYLPDGRIASINDELGVIYFVNFDVETDSLETIEFGKEEDYEEIVKVGESFWVMESNGDLYQVSASGEVHKYQSKEIKKTEFEAMYFDEPNNRLVLVTKDHKEIDRAILAYSFDLSSNQFSSQPIYEITMPELHYQVKNSSVQFKPSAAAVHPVLNKVFIIASVGKILLRCSLEGKIEKAYKINPVKFQQPEGITFAPNGDMYISNEAAQGKATILKFPYENLN